MRIADTQELFYLDHDIWLALSGARIAQHRIDAVEKRLEQVRINQENLQAAVRTANQEVRDLRIHLKDRDAHIHNLEAQLRPLLVDSHGAGGNQEAIL